jgi:hypothetical protein
MTPFQIAYDELGALGLVLIQAPGEYRVNFHKGAEATEYRTDSLQDAVERGRVMALDPPPPPEPPIGPTGGGKSRRGQMYKHNRKLAARRRRRLEKGKFRDTSLPR